MGNIGKIDLYGNKQTQQSTDIVPNACLNLFLAHRLFFSQYLNKIVVQDMGDVLPNGNKKLISSNLQYSGLGC